MTPGVPGALEKSFEFFRSPYPYGTHHTKLMILVYSDNSVRIVVSTANLVPSDWQNRTQGLWVSPKCPPTEAGETPKVIYFFEIP